jgi:hypothetical protein
MTTPTQQIIQRGSFANDGKGDTLRDAAQKINDNFTYLWQDTYAGQETRPGRKFVCASITTGTPDSGEFTINSSNLRDANHQIRISRYDMNDHSYKTSTDSSGISGMDLSMWSLDSGTISDWNLLAKFRGTIQYTSDTWIFQKDSTSIATTDGVDSGGTYYIKLDGVW